MRFIPKNHRAEEYTIKRSDSSTNTSSYDCLSDVDGIKFLINIKAEKKNNNAIAVIEQLYCDYVAKNPEKIKAYLVLKVLYKIDISKRENERKIFIRGIDSFFLEEIDLSHGHKQDKRNWPEVYNPNSGRLQATPTFRKRNKIDNKDVSYKGTMAID